MCLLFRPMNGFFRKNRLGIAAIAALFFIVAGRPAFALTQVSIGMLIDGHTSSSQAFVRSLQDELTRLLGSKYAIQVENTDVLDADWSAADAKRGETIRIPLKRALRVRPRRLVFLRESGG